MNVIQERRCCTNHIGYEVQHMTPNDWQPCSIVFKTEPEADLHKDALVRDGTEFRVAKAFEGKKK